MIGSIDCLASVVGNVPRHGDHFRSYYHLCSTTCDLCGGVGIGDDISVCPICGAGGRIEDTTVTYECGTQAQFCRPNDILNLVAPGSSVRPYRITCKEGHTSPALAVNPDDAI